jgi:hypothetical protein
MSSFKYPNPLSAKKTRAAVRDLTIYADQQTEALGEHEKAINDLMRNYNVLRALAQRPLLGRLRWVFTGK